MAVYDRSYRRYEGPLTPSRTRFLILPRYALAEVFRSRWFVSFFVLCFALPFVGLLLIYLHHNLSALNVLNLPLDRLKEALPIDARFFATGFRLQGFLAFVLALVVGPSLIAPDLRNNGLALYLARPLSRAEYVLGKMTVLALLLSAITWVPSLLLFLFQGYLEGAGWLAAHLRIGFALWVGSWLWIAVLSLLALAVSAWVKWKPVARIAMLMVFLVMNAFGRVAELSMGTWWGELLNLWQLVKTIWAGLFGVAPDSELPLVAAWIAFSLGCLALLGLLSRRLRAYEVVR
ncbi:MAG: hypothetical protein M3O15_05625 [Acidobacteriota bacterium]|nr:hypothetical protein [Acidobacteriota bacterium]